MEGIDLQEEHVAAMATRALNWDSVSSYTGHDADITTAHGKKVKNAYRRDVGLALNSVLGDGLLYVNGGDSEHIDQALPRSSTIEECIAMYTALQSMPGALPRRLAAANRMTVPNMLRRIATSEKISKVIVARETGYAAYFTYADATTRGKILTTVVLRSNNDIVYDLFRSFQCDFTDVGNSVCHVLRTAGKSAVGYIYMELEHMPDRYKVTLLWPVNTSSIDPATRTTTVWNSLPDVVQGISAALEGYQYTVHANADQSISYGGAVAAPRHSFAERTHAEVAMGYTRRARSALPASNAPHVYVSHGYRFLPTGSQHPYCPKLFDLQSLFSGPADVDRECRTYCHRRARGPFTDNNTRFMRSMQVQERTGSLAGLIARRYSEGMSPGTFVDNMQETARRNQDPMDMDHTVRALAGLSLRRGSGTYASYIRVPQHPTEERMSILDFWPLYPGTWDALVDRNNLEGQLVPTGI